MKYLLGTTKFSTKFTRGNHEIYSGKSRNLLGETTKFTRGNHEIYSGKSRNFQENLLGITKKITKKSTKNQKKSTKQTTNDNKRQQQQSPPPWTNWTNVPGRTRQRRRRYCWYTPRRLLKHQGAQQQWRHAFAEEKTQTAPWIFDFRTDLLGKNLLRQSTTTEKVPQHKWDFRVPWQNPTQYPSP